jgi:hypothetical protein
MDRAELDRVLVAHAAWHRGEPDGARANLAGANLARANLARANIDGANLDGASLDGAKIARYVAGGWLRAYGWTALAMEDGSINLRYGCEAHALSEWPGIVRAKCEQHVSDVDGYERDLRALFVFIAALASVPVVA